LQSGNAYAQNKGLVCRNLYNIKEKIELSLKQLNSVNKIGLEIEVNNNM